MNNLLSSRKKYNVTFETYGKADMKDNQKCAVIPGKKRKKRTVHWGIDPAYPSALAGCGSQTVVRLQLDVASVV